MKLTGIKGCRNEWGFSLVETMVTLVVFSVVTTGIFVAFDSQMKNTRRETSVGQAEIEFTVAKGLLERDLAMAGYGLADSYGVLAASFNPLAFQGVNRDTASDDLILMGTALGVKSRQAQGWTYLKTTAPTFESWPDSRERVEAGDRVVLMDPTTKTLLTQNVDGVNYWLYKYVASNSPVVIAHSTPPETSYSSSSRYLVYGLYGSDNNGDDELAELNPYYAVRYYRGGDVFPPHCADGTANLLRAESRKSDNPGNGDPLLSCVLDFQVVFGLDRDENGAIDTWDNGGATYLNGYTRENQRKRLKQVRAYLLVQAGSRDTTYAYPQASTRVGEILTIDGVDHPTGRVVNLTAAQRQYRWKLVVLNLTPKNLR